MSKSEDCALARGAWADALSRMSDGPERTAELRQMLLDALDAVEQSGKDEDSMIAALRGFESVRDRNRR